MVGLAAATFPRMTAGAGTTSGLVAKQYQGTRDGKILESLNGGASWTQVANFGDRFVVQSITTPADGSLTATVVFATHAFTLHSTDGRTWRTA